MDEQTFKLAVPEGTQVQDFTKGGSHASAASNAGLGAGAFAGDFEDARTGARTVASRCAQAMTLGAALRARMGLTP